MVDRHRHGRDAAQVRQGRHHRGAEAEVGEQAGDGGRRAAVGQQQLGHERQPHRRLRPCGVVERRAEPAERRRHAAGLVRPPPQPLQPVVGHERRLGRSVRAVTAVTDVSALDLPDFDLGDPTLHGPAFHAAMAARRRAVLARPSAARLPRCSTGRPASTSCAAAHATFPGQLIAELYGIESGPLREEIDRNILHIDGDDHARLRRLVNPFFTPRAADRWRPAMRGFLEELWSAVDGSLRARRGVRQAVPVADDRDGHGRADQRRAAAARVVELDPAAVRRTQPASPSGPRIEQARRRSSTPGATSCSPHGAATPATTSCPSSSPPSEDGDRLTRRRAGQPGAERPHRRGRHDAGAAGPRAAAVRRAPRPVGAAGPLAGARAARGRGGAAARADHAVHRAAC